MLAPLLALVAFASLPAAVIASRQRGPGLFRWVPRYRIWLGNAAVALALIRFLARPGPGRLVALLVTGVAGLISRFTSPDRAFVAVDDPIALSAARAGLSDAAPVIGLDLDGVARAYALDTVAYHHLINDTLGDRPVLVSYCPLCRSAVAFDAAFAGQRLLFRVAGLWRRNMVMRDLATDTIWQQTTGEAEHGPLAGRALEMLPAELSTWAAWRADHPATTAVVEPPLSGMAERRRRAYLWGFQRFDGRANRYLPGRDGLAVDPRLPDREEVAGIDLAGETCAYPLSTLRRAGAIDDTVAGRTIRVTYEVEANRVRALGPNGEPIPVKRELWLAWSEFHPGTRVFVKTGRG